MKRTSKLFLALLLTVLAAALLAVGFTAAAEEPAVIASGYCGGEGDGTNLTWTLTDDWVLTVSGEGKMADYYSSSPYYAQWTDRKDDVQTIVIEDGVTTIATHAFQAFTSLTQITIPDSVTSIGVFAFQNCTSLTGVRIPNSVTQIGGSSFQNCTSLKEVVLPDSATDISSSTFSGCTALTSVEMPNTVTRIQERAFEGCSALPSVTLSTGLTSLGDYAFLSCTSLTEIDIPGGVTSIGKYAFYGCTALANITVPDGVTNVGSDIMTNTAWFNAQPNGLVYLGKIAYTYKGDMPEQTSLVLNDTCNAIAARAFIGCTGITSVVIPGNVKTVGESAFSQCSGMTDLTIENGVESIEASAFAGCNGLTSVTIPQSVIRIGTYGSCYGVFSNCASLTELLVDENNPNYSNDEAGCLYDKDKKTLFFYPMGKPETVFTIPDGVTSIHDGAFSYCQNLTRVIIPDSVTWIEDVAFACTGLTSITIPNGVIGIGENVFACCAALKSIIISESLRFIGDWAFTQCTALKDVYYMGTEEQWEQQVDIAPRSNDSLRNANYHYYGQDWGYCGDNGAPVIWVYDAGTLTISGEGRMKSYRFNNKLLTLPWAEYRDEIRAVVIEDGVTTVGAAAFYNYTNLTSVTIPDSVGTVENYAFYGCNGLKTVTSAKNITSIENSAFYGCSSLTDISLGKGMTSISEASFEGCTSLTSLRIPATVTTIFRYAFAGCSGLKNVTLSERTNIGSSAFSGCSNLQDIYYMGWNYQFPVLPASNGGILSSNPRIHYNTVDWGYCGGEGDGTGVTWWLNAQGVLVISGEGPVADANNGAPVWANSSLYDAETGEMPVTVKQIFVYSGVTSLPQNACSPAPQLERVSLGDTLTEIGDSAFADCGAPREVCYAGSEAQWGQIDIGSENDAIQDAAKRWNTVDWGSCGTYGNEESATWTLDKDGLVLVRGEDSCNMQTIDSIALYDTADTILVEEGVTRIEMCAFTGLTMKHIVLPASVTFVEACAFMNCEELETLTILNPDLPLNWNNLPYHEGGIYSQSGGGGPVTCYDVLLRGYLGSTTAKQGAPYSSWPFAALCPADYTHTVVERADTAPACATKWYCEDCGKYLIDPTADAGEHTPGAPVRENEIAATCTAAGSYTQVRTCTACGNEISRTAVTVDPLNHKNAYSVAATEATATAHGYTAGTYCPDCDTWLSGHDVIHNHLGEQTIIKAPTDTEEGLVDIVCTVCNEHGLYTASKTEPKPTDDGGSSGDSGNGGFWQKIQTFTKGVIKWFLQLFKWFGKK